MENMLDLGLSQWETHGLGECKWNGNKWIPTSLIRNQIKSYQVIFNVGNVHLAENYIEKKLFTQHA